jgi:hypothetical protein
VFPLSQVPVMGRGKGVRLQRYRDGGISDVKVFYAADGLTWTDSAGRTWTKPMQDLTDWLGDRAAAGRQPPTASRATTSSSAKGFSRLGNRVRLRAEPELLEESAKSLTGHSRFRVVSHEIILIALV